MHLTWRGVFSGVTSMLLYHIPKQSLFHIFKAFEMRERLQSIRSSSKRGLRHPTNVSGNIHRNSPSLNGSERAARDQEREC